jgi:long-chain acyl-CoA synthetase
LAIMLPNSIEFAEALAASAKVGAAVLTLNWHLKADEVAWILEDSGASVLVTHDDLRPVVEAVTDRLGEPVVWVGDDYEDRLADASAEPLPYVWPIAWPVLYTSGTSGRPKGVVHGGEAAPEIMEMAQDGLLALWGYRPDDVHLVAGPMYHAGPAGYASNTLYAGGTVVAMESWDVHEFLRLVDAHRVTTTFLTPAHFIRILEVPEPERAGFDLSSLRHVIHAGAPCPVPVKERMIAALPHTEIWELYGSSEGGATRVSSKEWLERPGTVGLPWPGVEVRIVDRDTGVELPAGEDGLIYVKPAYGRFRYHNDPAKTAETWREEDFTVGDVGHLDDDGYLFLTDRASDMIIRAGVNVYPREVEDVLYQHPAVVDCAVFGVPHDRNGEHPIAVVETRSPVAAEELVTWCRDRLDPYKCPDRVELVDTLPRDPNGKVLKRHLRDEAWASAGRSI